MDEPPRVGHTHSLAIRGRPHIILLHVRDSDFDRSIITGDLAVMTFIRVVLVIAAITPDAACLGPRSGSASGSA